jgi:hypothetical protein
VHIKGEDNVALADTLSCHPNMEEEEEIDDESGQALAYCMARLVTYEEDSLEELYAMERCYAKTPVTKEDIEVEHFPMAPKLIASREQKKDKKLLNKVMKVGTEYSTTFVENVELITHKEKILVPHKLQARIVAWYHEYLAHPGETRNEEKMQQVFIWKGLSTEVKGYCQSCHKCQMAKKQRKKYGHLPAKTAEMTPWRHHTRVNVDVVGPYTVRTPQETKELLAMMMIDPATGWFEVGAISTPSSDACQQVFDSLWLSPYPRPSRIGYDSGSLFKKYFKAMIENYSLKGKPSTEYNPQSNGVIEHVHPQVIGNSLRSFELTKRDLPDENPWNRFLKVQLHSQFVVLYMPYYTPSSTRSTSVWTRHDSPFEFQS